MDEKKSPYLLDAYMVPETIDNILWHTYDLKSSEHTLRIVTFAKADPRSQDHKICIEKAILYHGKI